MSGLKIIVVPRSDCRPCEVYLGDCIWLNRDRSSPAADATLARFMGLPCGGEP